MIKRKTYSLEEDNRTLIHKESYDENGNVVHSIDYRESPPVELNFEYDSDGNLIRQSEIQGGIENSSQIFEYDAEGDIIDEKLSIGGALYEHTSLVKTDSGFIRTMTQDNEEVERLEKNIDGDNWSNKFYRYDELLESQKYTFDAKNNSGETIIEGFEHDFNVVIKEKYSNKDEIILKEEFHENGTLLTATEIEIEDGLTLKESVKDFSNGEVYYERLFEYDKNNNIINFEVRSSTGALQSFHKRKFDNQNRLIEETGFTNCYFSGIDGVHKNHNCFHLIHEYE
ncbi:MAG: hypothetical protein KJ941_11605 [Bacteroidetes bacterium]|nr:hypothetical protein [Bacteroidota bacterium]